nr:wax ester/triacylglycerol synthase family O-acyltransferase [Smaragdicoccus niigatensis]
MTALDAAFLELEDSDRHVNLAIGGVSVVGGPVPDERELMDALVSRVVSLPRYRQVLRFKPFDLGAPEWVDDPDFDFAHHIHRTALPSPGDDSALYDLVAEAMSHRLDRDRPLWESWIIEGLSDGRWAILIKIHHCIADGISAARAVTSLCDDAELASYADHIRAATESPAPNVFSHNPLRWPGEIVHGSLGAPAAVLRAATGAAQIVKSIVWPSADSSLNGPISKQRRFGAARVSLADIARVRRAFDVTVNDVALAAIADAYRDVLLRRGETPHPDTMRTLVPVSVRTADATGDLGNRVSVMLPLLPVDIADPVERLQAVHSRMHVAKSSGQREAGSSLVDAARYLPFLLTAPAVRMFAHFPQRGIVALATNVPGPRKPLHILGRQVLEMIPVPPIAMRLRTGIAMLSYADTLTFGVTADHDAAPDVAEIAAGIERAVERLVELSRGPGSTV